jgi:endonuclease YncB( thermonuclease family)
MSAMILLALAAAVVVPSGQTFECTPTAVYDGDGPIWCAEGPRIRVAGIAAREMDGTCRTNQPCPDASPERSRDHLARLVGTHVGRRPEGHILVKGPTMRCQSEGNGVGSRTAAWCVSPIGGDLSCSMVQSGAALRWDRYWHAHRCSR